MSSFSRRYGGSPVFTGGSETDTLTSGEIKVYDFAKNAEASEKYAPFNNLTVTNNDASNDLTVKVNQDDGYTFLIPAGTIRSFDQRSVPAIWSLQVKNDGAGTNSSYRVSVQKEVIGTQDVVENTTRMIFGLGKKDVI